jgi:uncharacterized phage protein (TIGR01671 family)
MSREIKFRAWNTEINHMVFPSLEFGREIWPCTYKRIIESEIDENGHCEQFVLEMVSVDHILQSPEYEVMQFTGIKDRNGVEIFEGDIMQHANPFDIPFIVNWIDSECGYGFNHGGTSYVITDKSFEVIGNIYENPELINY